MSRHALRIHDANQGAQSKGQMWGMTGNTPWYLFGAAGLALVSVIFGYGVLGLPFMACILFGGVLVSLALVYVFFLKNNRPEHYDTDFLETTLVEAGLIDLRFGPRFKRPENPFFSEELGEAVEREVRLERDREKCARVLAGGKTEEGRAAGNVTASVAKAGASETTEAPATPASSSRVSDRRTTKEEKVYTQAAYEKLEQELEKTRDDLDDALCALEE